MPASRDASASSPTAYTWRPQAVWLRANPITTYSSSITITPVVMLRGPMLMLVPVHSSRPGRSAPTIACPLEYSSASAVNTLSVPRVTMNGGRFRRVTSVPFSAPAPRATTRPITRASTAGTPFLAKIVPITRVDRMATAPTDRSMPAVRMMRV